tara:strand:- start:1200 stop:1511 length:312 start_codon:yes stop_codon:yes gene_type:complete
MKLEKVIKSDAKNKKFTAIFCMCNGKSNCCDKEKKKVHFGSKGMDDYTIKKDKEQRDRYRTRHKKDLETKDPTRAGYLSYYLLWGDSTSLQENIKDYKKRFNL